MIKNNFAIRVSLNFIHLFEYKLHKYAPKTPCHLRFAAFPPYMSLRRFVCGDKNLKKQIVFVVESSQLGWRCLKTPGNLRRVQHPMRTISHQFIYTWPMNKNDRISRWRHSRICGGTSVVQPHGVELFNFQTRDLWASLTPMANLHRFPKTLLNEHRLIYWTRYKYIHLIYIYMYKMLQRWKHSLHQWTNKDNKIKETHRSRRRNQWKHECKHSKYELIWIYRISLLICSI